MKGGKTVLEAIMKQARLRKFVIASSTVAFAALFSVGWSEQRGISLSVESAQARARVYIYSNNPYVADTSGLSWYAVRAYYAGGPWCGIGSAAGYGTYGTAGGLWGGAWTCYSGWPDYAQRNGIGCTPGSLVKGGDGINYVCQ
jgi:hypothetical protein